MQFLKKNMNTILFLAVIFFAVYYLNPGLFGVFEGMCGGGHVEKFCGDGCGEMGYPYGCGEEPKPEKQYENFSSCYQRKQIYLNSCDPDEPTGHADVNLERRFGKLYITINANLPYAKGGTMNTMWGSWYAFLVDTRNNKSINLGSLVRHGDRFYKLSTELLGEYSNYNEIRVYRQSEDYKAKLILSGKIAQQCSSL